MLVLLSDVDMVKAVFAQCVFKSVQVLRSYHWHA